jgi:penicillin amidase
MTTTLRLLRAAALPLALASAAVGAGYYALFRRSQPRIRGQMALPGLQGTVEVIRDRWGIPHIFAQDRHDLFFGLGFVHAQDRLWHMEFNRRTPSGTLCEILGEAALEADRLMRRVGLRRAAERETRRLDPETATIHEAYCRGINAFLEQHQGPWPLEFTILRTRPASWTTADSLVLGRLMAATLAGNWDAEIARSWLVRQVGADAMADLEPPHAGGMPLVLPAGAESSPPDQRALQRARETGELAALTLGGGSNNWVVDGQKSATGMPLLANDPHLPPTMPMIWYQVHLKGGGFDVIGVSIPGLPGIAIGHNDRIAWGLTASVTDQQDLFVERVNPENPRQYEYQGQWREGTIIREEINIRGRAQPVVEEVLVTEHGPDIGPCIPGESRTLALRSIVLEEDGLTRL